MDKSTVVTPPSTLPFTPTPFAFSHLRIRFCSLDWALAFRKDRHVVYTGIKPDNFKVRIRDDNLNFTMSEGMHVYTQYKYMIGKDVILSAQASSRSNLGLAFGYEFGSKGVSIEGHVGLTSHALGMPRLTQGFSINFEME